MGTSAEKHARQKERRDRVAEARQRMDVAARRRRLGMIVAAVVAVLAVIVGIVVLTGGEDGDDDPTPTTQPPESGIELPEPPEGIALTGATECPPAEGADERVETFAEAPPQCIDPAATYSATFETSHGDFTATLDTAAAPLTVNNFVVLSRYRYYDGVPFHRIVPGFVIQAGDGDGDPWGNNELGYTFADELPADPSAYTDYSLTMANRGPDTNGSQFFVVLQGGGAQLGANYSRFGEITEGRDVIDAIGRLGDRAQKPTEVVLIERITVEEAPAA